MEEEDSSEKTYFNPGCEDCCSCCKKCYEANREFLNMTYEFVVAQMFHEFEVKIERIEQNEIFKYSKTKEKE